MEAGAREDDVELAWKAALDDEAFAKLSEADLGYPAHTAIGPTAAASMSLEPNQRQDPQTIRPRHHVASQRFKRKNFSKELQLLSLQRYAQYARDFGRLPDKHETQQLLQQSYLQFLKEGGASEEPRLTPPEFLKLIRNRRREINARALRPLKQKEDQVAARRMAVLTPAKRKLQEEHAKIRELIEVIDRTREQAGLLPEQQQQQRRLKPQQMTPQGHVQQPQQHQHQHQTPVDVVMVPPPMIESLPPLSLDPMEQMEAILQIHQETREVQREIAARLRAISRVINQHDGHGGMEEPSSASV